MGDTRRRPLGGLGLGAPHLAIKGGIVNQKRRLRPILVLGLVAAVAVLGLAWAMEAAGASESPAPLSAGSASPGSDASAAAGKIVYRVGWTREPDNLSPFVGYAAPAFEESGTSPTTRSSVTTPRRSHR